LTNIRDIESDELSALKKKKQPFEEPQDLIRWIHPVEGQNNYQNYHLSDSHRTINLGEDSPEEEDSQEAEDSLEEEDSPEAEDTREEVEYHLEGHQEAVGDHHHCPWHKHNQENWWENHLRSTMVIGRRQLSSSMNGSCTGQSTTITPS